METDLDFEFSFRGKPGKWCDSFTNLCKTFDYCGCPSQFNEMLVIEMLLGFRYVRYSNLPPKYDFVFEKSF